MLLFISALGNNEGNLHQFRWRGKLIGMDRGNQFGLKVVGNLNEGRYRTLMKNHFKITEMLIEVVITLDLLLSVFTFTCAFNGGLFTDKKSIYHIGSLTNEVDSCQYEEQSLKQGCVC